MDDQRVGRALRLLRQRRGLTQAEVAAAAGVSQSLVSLMEHGHLDSLGMRTIRRVFAAVDAGFEGHVAWRGGTLDRLLDEAHARLVEASLPMLTAAGWEVAVEASYSVYGERGSIDVFAAHRPARAALVAEVKAELTSREAVARKTDEKVRLARARLCRERFGFAPAMVGRVLSLPSTDAARRRVARASAVLDVLFPERTRAVRAWVRRPVGHMAGVVLVAIINGGGRSVDRRGRQRVRRPRDAAP